MSLAREFRVARERPIGFAPEHPHDIKLRIDEPEAQGGDDAAGEGRVGR